MSIRRQPEDFRVRERLRADVLEALAAAPDAGRRWAVMSLEKTSLTTPDATALFAKAVGVAAAKVEHAGLKDKHAITTQHVSVECESRAVAQRAVAGPSGRGWTSRLIGFAAAPLDADDIERNEFDILVTDLSRQAAHELLRRSRILEDAAGGLAIINYFGDQRFGSARHGHGFAATHLLRGDFEQALKLLIATPARKDAGARRILTRLCATHWGNFAKLAAEAPKTPERRPLEVLAGGGSFREAFEALPYFVQQMSVDALQSSVWNTAAAGLVRSLNDSDTLHADDDFGAMLFPPARAIPDEWRRTTVPTPGPDAPPSALADAALFAALQAHGLGSMQSLKIPGLRRPALGSWERSLAVTAEAFVLGEPEPDPVAGGRRVRIRTGFALPRGAYATVVLRALGQ